jgi:type IV pilus assembly protein PilA
MDRLASRRRKAFTLVELLVVVLIIAILAAIALPLYLSAVADSQVKTARANMQTIADAVQAYAARWTVFTSSFAALSGDLQNSTGPLGPGTRTYTITIGSGTCTDNCPGGVCNNVGNVPPNEFSISSNVSTDGVFCPGISPD